ncbi:ABC transporter [seawater metagenome]|uniref:ABC transporter n=1 Tax=seawater metagenome TaxID=1561972 RepID=A0A5E8CMC4_9ZZZZ
MAEKIFTIPKYLKDYFSKKYNLLILLSCVLLSFHNYLRSIQVPKLLANINITNIRSIIPLLSTFILYYILYLFYMYNGNLVCRSVHMFSYNYIFQKLMIINTNNLDEKIDSSVYVSVVAYVNYLTSLINSSIEIIPYFFSTIFIGFYLYRNISPILNIVFILLILVQGVYLFFYIKKTRNAISKFNFIRHKLIDFNQDINTNMQQIISLNGFEKEKISLKKNSDNMFPSYIKFQFYKISQVWFIIFSNLLFLIYGIIFILRTNKLALLKQFIFIYIYYIYLAGDSLNILNNISAFLGMIDSSYNKIINNVNNNIINNETISRQKNINLNSNNSKILKLTNICFSYQNKQIFKDLNMEFELGPTYGIIGKIGSGKSTLLKIIFGIQKIEKGNIFLGKQNFKETSIEEWRNNFNYFQQTSTILSRTIEENIFYPSITALDSKIALLKKIGIYEIVQELLEEKQKKAKLSGGQKQIILLIRLIFNPKKIILLDEPTSSLDSNTKKYVIKIIKYLKSLGSTLIIITHDHEIMEIVDNIIDISKLIHLNNET